MFTAEEIVVEHIIVARQLGSVITAHRFVEVRRIRAADLSHVEHSVIHGRVGEDSLVGRCGLKHSLIRQRGGHEAVGVEIAFVDGVEIDKHYHADTCYHPFTLHDAAQIEQQQSAAAQHDDQRPLGIAAHHAFAERLHLAVGLAYHRAVDAVSLKHLLLVRQQTGLAEQRRTHQRHKAYHDHSSETPQQFVAVAAPELLFRRRAQLLESHHGKERHGELGHHKRALGRSEFIEQRHVVEHEITEPQEIVTPGHDDRHDCQH